MTHEEAEKVLVDHFTNVHYTSICLWLQSMDEEQFQLLEEKAKENGTDVSYELVKDFRESYFAH